MTDGTVQSLRHAAKAALSGASGLLAGQPGLTLEVQIERLQKAFDLTEEARDALEDALNVVEGRQADAPEASDGDDALVAKITAAVFAALKG